MKVTALIALMAVSNGLHLEQADKPGEATAKRKPPPGYNMGSLKTAGSHEDEGMAYAKLWLSYGDHKLSQEFKEQFKVSQLICGNQTAEEPMGRACDELAVGLAALLEHAPEVAKQATKKNAVILELTEEKQRATAPWPPKPHEEGFSLKTTSEGLKISSASGPGLLRGAFWLLNLIQREAPELQKPLVNINSAPTMPLRLWDLWDNRDRSVERGYAGRSVFYFEELPNMLPRYKDYARLLASTGINAIVWNNVNACFFHNEALLKSETIASMTPLVKLFNDYGIRSFLTPCYESPRLDLKSANPTHGDVKAWWAKKAQELKTKWPAGAFGGFMFKADSEGQPGPKVYNVPEIQGANLMGAALDPVGAIVIWRAFSHPGRGDADQYLYQAKRFSQWEGKTRDNVVLQLKYGAGDFQVTEPVHALFGKLKSVNKIMEIQATQEYTGQARHVAHLLPLWKQALDFDTYSNGHGSTVAKVLTGQLRTNPSKKIFTGIAAVSNIGDSKTWTGHPMSAANTYGAGRLAWDPSLSATDITKEWIDLTFGKSETVEKTLLPMMMRSLSVWENFTAPLGWGWHVGKAKVYGTQHYYMDLSAHNYQFMRANKDSIGVKRTCVPAGECYNNYYNSPIKGVYGDVDKCPDKMLLHFHMVSYDHKLHDGRKVGDAIYQGYEHGAAESAKFVDEWDTLKDVIDTKSTGMTHAEIREKLHLAASDARGFAKNGTEWFQTVRSGGKPFSYVHEMNKRMKGHGKGARKPHFHLKKK